MRRQCPICSQTTIEFSVPFDIDLIQRPDLSITNPSAPDSADLGDTVSVSWTVSNQGAGDATGNVGWHDAVYFSTDSVLDTADQLLSIKPFDSFDPFFNSFTPLSSGGQYSVAVDVGLPSDLVGDYFLLLVADKDQSVWDTDRGNNLFAKPISMLASDLVISDTVLSPANQLLDGDVTVSWTVENQGSAPAFGNWQDRVWFSTDDQLGVGDVQLASLAPANVSPLSVAGQYGLSSVVTLPGRRCREPTC